MERHAPLTAILLVVTMGCAFARDYGYHNSPEISEWFKNLERPDLPGPRGNRSCCDVSDCHRTEFTLKDGHYRAGRLPSRYDERQRLKAVEGSSFQPFSLSR